MIATWGFRALTIAMATLSFAYFVACLRTVVPAVPVLDLGAQLSRGGTLEDADLLHGAALAKSLRESGRCYAGAARSAVQIEAELYETAHSNRREQDEENALRDLDEALAWGRACAPLDGFLRLHLVAWGVIAQGFGPEQAEQLRIAYRLAPHEGWIAFRRVRLALRTWPLLPPDLQDKTVSDFSALAAAESWRQLVPLYLFSFEPERRVFQKLLERVDSDLRQRLIEEIDLVRGAYGVRSPAPASPRPQATKE